MVIAIIASDKRKELMTEFCVAHCGILSRHTLYATGTTGNYLEKTTGLKINKLMDGAHGGTNLLLGMVQYNDIDMLIYFRDADDNGEYTDTQLNLVRECDRRMIPMATNIATAEGLIHALADGVLDWREMDKNIFN